MRGRGGRGCGELRGRGGGAGGKGASAAPASTPKFLTLDQVRHTRRYFRGEYAALTPLW